jgi:hypothetical protein
MDRPSGAGRSAAFLCDRDRLAASSGVRDNVD